MFPSDSTTIYLDHAATTPVDPDVARAMQPYLTEHFGNPSSIYQVGQDGRAGLDRARASIARVLGCQPSEIVFTSGATESDNLALSGVAWQARLRDPSGPMPHVITTAIEHHAVLDTAKWLARIGFAVDFAACDQRGIVSPETIEQLIRPETCLISVIYANNEVGSIQPVAMIGEIAKRRGIPFHIDATQAAGLLPLNVRDFGADLLSLSAHKFYGPKGVGLLYVRKGVAIAWQQHGGGQESGRRAGTENVAGIVGMAVALEKAEVRRGAYLEHCRDLRDRLAEGILENIPDVRLNGPEFGDDRLANNLHVEIPGVQGETVLLSLDMEGVEASAGSACTTGNSEPSHVLLAMGMDEERARASLRFSVGLTNTPDQIDDAIDTLVDTVNRIRELSAVR
jgi:cysteine desulfurase